MIGIALVTAEAAEEGGLPPEVWGVGALVALFGLLTLTLVFGKGRLHA